MIFDEKYTFTIDTNHWTDCQKQTLNNLSVETTHLKILISDSKKTRLFYDGLKNLPTTLKSIKFFF